MYVPIYRLLHFNIAHTWFSYAYNLYYYICVRMCVRVCKKCTWPESSVQYIRPFCSLPASPFSPPLSLLCFPRIFRIFCRLGSQSFFEEIDVRVDLFSPNLDFAPLMENHVKRTRFSCVVTNSTARRIIEILNRISKQNLSISVEVIYLQSGNSRLLYSWVDWFYAFNIKFFVRPLRCFLVMVLSKCQ